MAYFFDKAIVPLTGPVNVSVLTTLLPFLDCTYYQGLSAHLENNDPTNNVTLIVDVSFGGVLPNLGRRLTAQAQPREECSIEIAPPMFPKFVRISAMTDGPAYPTVAVKWALHGKWSNLR